MTSPLPPFAFDSVVCCWLAFNFFGLVWLRAGTGGIEPLFSMLGLAARAVVRTISSFCYALGYPPLSLSSLCDFLDLFALRIFFFFFCFLPFPVRASVSSQTLFLINAFFGSFSNFNALPRPHELFFQQNPF